MRAFLPADQVRRAAVGLADVLLALGEWLQPPEDAANPVEPISPPTSLPAVLDAYDAWRDAVLVTRVALAEWREAGPTTGSQAYETYLVALDREDAAAREPTRSVKAAL